MAVNAKGKEITSIWTPANVVTCVRIVFIPLFMIVSEWSFGLAANGGAWTSGALAWAAFVLYLCPQCHRQGRWRFGAQARRDHRFRQVLGPHRRQAAGVLGPADLARARPGERVVRVHHHVPRVPRQRAAHGGERERRGHRRRQARKVEDRGHHGVACAPTCSSSPFPSRAARWRASWEACSRSAGCRCSQRSSSPSSRAPSISGTPATSFSRVSARS